MINLPRKASTKTVPDVTINAEAFFEGARTFRIDIEAKEEYITRLYNLVAEVIEGLYFCWSGWDVFGGISRLTYVS